MPQPLALIIEDQKSLAVLYEDTLRLVGFDVKLIHDGLAALNHLETHSLPDFIILDVNLPSLSGRDILKHIRGSDRYKNIPVLVLTANTLMIDQIKPDISETDYLHAKPIGMMELQGYATKVRKEMKQRSDSLAATQPIPVLNDEDNEPSEVIFPDNTIRDTSELPVADKKVQTQEHIAILTPDDESSQVIFPDNTIHDTSEIPVADKKVQTQEYKAILTPDDTAIEIGEPESSISDENENEAT